MPTPVELNQQLCKVVGIDTNKVPIEKLVITVEPGVYPRVQITQMQVDELNPSEPIETVLIPADLEHRLQQPQKIQTPGEDPCFCDGDYLCSYCR